MDIIVQKYGGSSVESPQKIASIASRIQKSLQDNQKILVVISAMGKQTDTLLGYAKELSPSPSKRELDMLLTVGERASMALLSIALGELSVKAISLTGSQSGILTSAEHGAARILNIRPKRIHASFEKSDVVIVAGFQGMCLETGEITTLGRGGSDLTAIALAHTLQAKGCHIYTDVDGVYNADPRKVSDAQKFGALSHELAVKLAESGAKVIHDRAAKLARDKQVSYEVKNAHNEKVGTEVLGNPMEMPELLFLGSPTEGNFAQNGIEQPGKFVSAIGQEAKPKLEDRFGSKIEWMITLGDTSIAKLK